MSDPISKYYETHYSKLALTEHMKHRIDLTIKNIKRHSVNAGISKVLEIGCGTGENLKKIKELFNVPDAIGIEISAEAVKKLNERGIKGIVADVNRDSLPLDDNTIDIVLFQEVIEHLYNSDLIMTEIRRVLKPRGLLILSTPNLASWTNRVALLFGFQPFSHDVSFISGFGRMILKEGSNGHIKSFTKRALLEYIRYFGFEIIGCKGVIADGVDNPLFRTLDKIFSRFSSFASHIFVVARKAGD